MIRYEVEGRVSFPIDMLRYDGATPARETDSATIASTFHARGSTDRFRVTLQADREPTRARWKSFGWRVVS